MLNVDTHIVVGFFQGTLRAAEERVLAGQAWGISAIVYWELYSLVRLGRLGLDLEAPDFNRDLTQIHTWPITAHVCRQIRQLDFRGDPADEIIAATSIAHGVPLLTRDARILRSKTVPLALG